MSIHQPRSLAALLEQSARNYPERPLFLNKIEGSWQATPYAEVAQLVARLRGGLSRLGIGNDDRVAIIAANREEWAVVAYATYGLGAILVPMYESQHERDWEFIVRDSGSKVLFVAPAVHQRALARLSQVPTLTHVIPLSSDGANVTYASLIEAGAGNPLPSAAVEPEHTAALLYTSGTTGEPKGVVLSHSNILSNVLALKEIVLSSGERPEEHRSLSFLPWAHAFGQTVELHLLVASGASTAIAEAVDKIVLNIQEVKPTLLVAVPRVFLKIYAGIEKLMASKPWPIRWLFRRGMAAATKETRGHTLRSGERCLWRLADWLIFSRIRARFGGRLRFAISGAASLPKEVAEYVDALGITVYEGYGLTETSPIAAANVPGHRKLGSVGRPLPGVRIVIDPSVTGELNRGEIVVYGPNVMRGYYNRQEETSAALLSDGGLRTGDLGYLDEDDYLFVTGRIKEQYKLANGKYVAPAPLEERLKLSPLIANVMIYGDNRPHNVALVVPEPAALLDWAAATGLEDRRLEDLVRHPRLIHEILDEIARLSTEFRSYERVEAIMLLSQDFTLENGMLTPSLKLKRRNVIERWGREIEALYRRDTALSAEAAPAELTATSEP